MFTVLKRTVTTGAESFDLFKNFDVEAFSNEAKNALNHYFNHFQSQKSWRLLSGLNLSKPFVSRLNVLKISLNTYCSSPGSLKKCSLNFCN